MRALALGLKFVVELAAFAALAYAGAQVGSGVVSVLVALALPALAIVLWGRFAAPRAGTRLPPARRIPFELAVFAVAVAALAVAGAAAAAVVLAVLVVVSAASLTALGEW